MFINDNEKPPTPARVTMILGVLLGVIGYMGVNQQPIILNGLFLEGKISASQLGLTATSEFLAFGLSSLLAGIMLRPKRLRLWGFLAFLFYLLSFLGAMHARGVAQIGLGGMRGVSAGIVLWNTYGLIARTTRSDWWAGVLQTANVSTALAVSVAFTALVTRHFGSTRVLWCLAVIMAIGMGLSLLTPNSYEELPKSPGLGRIAPRAFFALASIFAYTAFIGAFWVYLEPIAAESGLSPTLASTAIAVSFGAQAIGGVVGTLLAGRLPPFMAIIGACIANILVIGCLLNGASAPVFLVIAAAYGFLCVFVMPFQVSMLMKVDPSRRTVMALNGTSLLGSSAGAFLASFVVSDSNVRGGFGVAAACSIVCLLIVLCLSLSSRRNDFSTTRIADGVT
jgi:DHA1 family inner membrane transport protein